jgi:hypothetical protein
MTPSDLHLKYLSAASTVELPGFHTQDPSLGELPPQRSEFKHKATSGDCRRYCGCQNLKEPQSSVALNKQVATGSISIT